jgi:hypothetical protein
MVTRCDSFGVVDLREGPVEDTIVSRITTKTVDQDRKVAQETIHNQCNLSRLIQCVVGKFQVRVDN